MANTPICTIDAAGIHKPSLATCLAYFQGVYQGIYGSDTYLGSDSQDGELVGLWAAALDDVNAMGVQAYNGYSPASAQGVALSSIVKTNGITRNSPTFSTVAVVIVGTVGLPINNGIIQDSNKNNWALPALVTIPSGGQITVTATCQTEGAITAQPQTFQIVTFTPGWNSATSTTAAAPGQPVELDAQLRIRQSNSTMLPSQTMLEGTIGAVEAITGVIRCRGYENETNLPDSNGLPGHSIAIIVDGGDAQTIANTISANKNTCGTYGSTTETVTDRYGVKHAINFSYVSEPNITWSVTLNPGPNYSISTNALIAQSLVNFTNALGIGNSIQLTRAYSAAYLQPLIAAAAVALQQAVDSGDPVAVASATLAFTTLNTLSNTYEITSLEVARDNNPPSASDVTIAFNEAPAAVVLNVTVTP